MTLFGQGQTFTFVDEAGAPQTRPVKDFLDPAALGYVYDNAAKCSRTAAGQLAAGVPTAGGGEQATMLGATKEIAIKDATTSVDIDAPKPQLQDALGDLERPGAMDLVLRDITAESHPGVLFDVYLARKGEPDTRQHVGTISWFGAFRHHGRTAAVRKTLRYDVTDELRALDGARAAASGLTVIIEVSHGRRSADPARGDALWKDAVSRFRPAANLKIGAIELHAKPRPD